MYDQFFEELAEEIEGPGGVSAYPKPVTGTPRLIQFLKTRLNEPEPRGEYDSLFQDVLNFGYEEWQKPEHEQWSFADMLDWMADEFGEDAALIIMLGRMNGEICNGGIVQWLDNGYASDYRGDTQRRHRYQSISPDMDLSLLERMMADLEGSALGRLPHARQIERTLEEIQSTILDSGEECQSCHNARYVKCEDCDGTGKMAEDDCDECNGSGEIDGEECPNCGGKGVIMSGEESCDICDGEGEVPCEDCNPEGQLERDSDVGEVQIPNFLDHEYYKFNKEWEAEVEGYLKGLVRAPSGQGLLSRTQAFKATESLLRELESILDSLSEAAGILPDGSGFFTATVGDKKEEDE